MAFVSYAHNFDGGVTLNWPLNRLFVMLTKSLLCFIRWRNFSPTWTKCLDPPLIPTELSSQREKFKRVRGRFEHIVGSWLNLHQMPTSSRYICIAILLYGLKTY